MFNTINSLVSQAIDSPDYFSGGTSTPSGNVLSGNIMAGASWNSTNTALQEALTQATGKPTQNFAIPGSTTSDTLKQLNDFLGGGGSFAPGATVFLQAGGVDFLNGVDKGTIKDNLNNIVSTLGDNGVKVVMTGSPYATSVADVQNNNFNPEVDPIYREVASANKNVALVDTMGNILQNKSLLKDALHTNELGTQQYNADVLAALASMNSSQIGSEKISANAQPDQLLNAAQTSAVTPTMSTAQAISAANQYAQANNVDLTGNINKWIDQNPNASAAQVNAEMAKYGVSQADVARAIAQRSDLNPNQPKLIGDTYYQPTYQGSGSGMDYQQGPLSDLLAYTQDQNKVGGTYNQYDAQGNLVRQGTQQKVSNSMTPFLLGSLGLFGGLGGGLESLLGGGAEAAAAADAAGGLLPAYGSEAAYTAGLGMTPAAEAALAAQIGGGTSTAAATTIAGTGMTLAELAQLDLSLGGAGGTAGALEMANAIGGTGAAAAAADVIAGMGGGTGLTTTGNTALSSMGGGTGLLPSTAANLEAMGGAQGLTTAAAGGGILGATGLNTGLGVGAGLGSTLAGLDTGVSVLTGGVTDMGGGTGITANNTGLGLVPSDAANLETMGGGQGLTTAGAGGGVLGETGLNTGLGVLGGTGLGTTLAGLNTGVTGGLTGAGTTMAGTAAGAAGGLGGGLGSTLAGLDTGVGAGLGAAAGGAAAGGLGSALGTSLGTGLGLSALGTGLGALANQSGISNARDLINQYGARAQSALSDAYRNAQGLNTANRTDLGNLYANTSGNLQNLYNQQVGYQAPYQDVGRAASQGLLANQPYFTHQFDTNDLNTNLAPNYAFMLGQGQMANQRAANAGGGALGGNALQGLQRYTQDYAGNAYQQAFNNYNTQRNNIYNTLAGMAGIGQTSAGQLTNLGTNYGSNMAGLSSNYGGNLTTNAGQGIGAANAYGLNQANLATGIGSALASNATQTGANNASLLSNLGNTALLGSMIKAT